MSTALRRIQNYVAGRFSRQARELARLRNLGRYRPATTYLFGSRFDVVCAESFVSQYEHIVKRGVYHFVTENPEPTILDCGANVGVSTVYFRNCYSHAKIVAFERV